MSIFHSESPALEATRIEELPRSRWRAHWPGVEWLSLVAVVAVATLLRFYRIDAQSLWYDEGISAFQLTRSYAEIVRAAAGDTHPPLYYWLLKAWGTAFGETEMGLRSLSAVLGVISVLLVWLLGRRLFGVAAATVGALFLTVSPLAVYYAQEVRMYTLVGALGLLAAWAYIRGNFVVYALAAAATLYSQYLGGALLAALHIHAVFTSRFHSRGWWFRWLLANSAAALLFLPWLPVFLDQSSHRALNTTPRTWNTLATATLSAYGSGLAENPAAVGVGALLVALAAGGAVHGVRRRMWSQTTLPLLLWVLPLGLVLTLGIRSGLFEVRYLLLGVPGLAILAGSGVVSLARLIGRRSRLVAWIVTLYTLAAVLVPGTEALVRQYFDPALARDDYRGAAQTIAQETLPGDAIVLAAPNQIEVFRFYYAGPIPLYPLPAQRPIDEVDTRERLESIAAQHRRVWLVSWALRQADPKGSIEDWLTDRGFRVNHHWFGTVQLMLFALDGETAPEEQLGRRLDNGAELRSVRLAAREARPGDALALQLVWRAASAPTERWKVFTHLVDAEGQVVTQRDAEPANDLRPTTTWAAGELIEDQYALVIPRETAPGDYSLTVGMYRSDGRRATFDGGGDQLVLARITVR